MNAARNNSSTKKKLQMFEYVSWKEGFYNAMNTKMFFNTSSLLYKRQAALYYYNNGQIIRTIP